MGRAADIEQLVGNIVRLRRAELTGRHGEDVAAVRADLEHSVGPTVARARAARLLGLSQTALDRWISGGDVPAVLTPSGRREVPLRTLVDLVLAVEERRHATGDPHAVASVLRRRRLEAGALDVEALVLHERRAAGAEHGHRRAELRSLAYHRAVAGRLDERIVADARERVRRWRAEAVIHPRHADVWETILAQRPARIAELIAVDDPEGRDLRQSSPLAGVLSERERRRVLDAVG